MLSQEEDSRDPRVLKNGRCAALIALYEFTLPRNPCTRPVQLKRLGPVVGQMLGCYSPQLPIRLDEKTFGLIRVTKQELRKTALNSDLGEEKYDFEESWDQSKRFNEKEWNKQKLYHTRIQTPSDAK